HEEISEIKLAELMKTEVNEARRVLYLLYHENLVSFKKKKDIEHGWYTYYWSFNQNRVGSLLHKTMNHRLNKLSSRLDTEQQNQFYVCCLRMDITTAMSYNFKCPECGQVMQPEDNTKRIDSIQQNIKEIKEFIKTYS
ncbi:MAG: hypothetical protein ACOC32_04835, partial [Nanoarchaeota archaeon]